MKELTHAPDWTPETVLLLGTDASGKNHVGRLLVSRMKEAGCHLDVREGFLCGKPFEEKDHGEKGRLALLAESVFLWLFPITRYFLPFAMGVVLRLDALRFKRRGQKTFVISHNALRVLAFCLGQNKRFLKGGKLSKWMEASIGSIQRASGALVIVLDVEDQIRQKRIQARLQEGSIDPFDRFMAADSERSEQIEACLVGIAQQYYGAHVIENNDLSDDALWEAFQEACERKSSR